MRLALLPLLMLPAYAAPTLAQTPVQIAASSSLSTQNDCVWKSETFSVGATFCWQPGRKLACSPPNKDHKQAWWQDQPEPVCGAADVP
jgi:hypothetical protein